MNEADKIKHAATEAAARQALDTATAKLAQQHRTALDQARRTALAQAKPAPSNEWRNSWVGFAVAAGLGALILMNTSFQPTTSDAPFDAAEHFAVLTELDATDYEIIEDLDFAYWLSTQDNNVAPEAAHNG